MRCARHGLLHRAVALALSWVFMATTVWASAPPQVAPPPAPAGPRKDAPAPRPSGDGWQTQNHDRDRDDDDGDKDHRNHDDDRDHGKQEMECCDRGHGGKGHDKQHTQCSCDETFFGPKKYTRTSGAPNVFTDTVAVPAWVVSPHVLKVENGAKDGSHRVSSATIWVNGKEVADPDDFSQHVSGFSRKVSLPPTSTLKVKLASSPGSYLTISLCGKKGDETPPQLTWTEPGPVVTTPTPHLALRYADVKGPHDALASGVDTSSLVVTLDGADRTALFTKGPSGATADVPAGLALTEGLHALKATVKDRAGNAASAEASFTVSARPPELYVDSPKSGDYLKATPVEVRGRVVGDPATVIECRAGSETVPGTRSGPGSEATFTCTLPLAEGANTIEVVARDPLGHETRVSVPVTLDTKPPQVTIDTPRDDSWSSAEAVDVTGHVEDASPIRKVTVNGVPATLTGSEFRAPRVPVGTGAIAASAEDAAGNAGEAAITLHVDRGAPTVEIATPLEEHWVLGPHVEVRGSVADPEGSPVVVEVNGTPEKDPPPTTVPRDFTVVVEAGEVTLDLVARARDAAGNVAETPTRRVFVDYSAPEINLSAPVGKPVTNAASIHVAGTVVDRSPVTLTVGTESVPVAPDGTFSVDVPLTGEGEVTIPLVATDSVALTGTLDVRVIVDRHPPEVQVVAPDEGHFVLALPVVVEGTVDDEPAGLDVPAPTVTVDGQPATVSGQVWTITFPALPDGPHTFTAVARDAAGNESTPATRDVVLDLFPPAVTITVPSEPVLTREETITVRGTVESRTAATVTVTGGADPVEATVTGPTWVAQVPLAEGDNTLVAVARSASGRESEPRSVLVTRDSTAPWITVLQTPDTIGRDKPSRGHVDAADNLPGVMVQVLVKKPGDPGDGDPVGPPAPPPYDFDIVAPADVEDGATLMVSAVARDKAGNESPHVVNPVTVAAGGVVVGQVLSDETGLPVPGATVVMETASGQRTAQSDARGSYSFPAGSAARVRASHAGMIPVERAVVVASGVGTVVLDVRLTRLAEAVVVTPAGLVLPKVDLPGPVAVELELHVPQDAVTQPTSLQLTPLSAQGLPGLLPLGWSPLAAFDVRADGPVAAGVEARLQKLPQVAQHLVRLDTGARAWTMVQPGLVPTGGALTLALDGTGSYALVVPDSEPAPTVPEPPGVLPGVAQADLPATAVGQGAVEPSSVPPTGGTASGRLFVLSPTPLPSGTAVQAEVTEEFELASGQKASEEVRREDILLFRAPLPADAPPTPGGETVLHAVLPVTASRTFETAELRQGKVHLDVLAGRESVRGETGGSRERTVQSGDAILSVPAASLAEDTAVSLEESSLSSFLPAETDVEPLAEVVVDFAGAVLGTSAGLSVACVAGTCTCSGGCAGDTLLVARVERVLGIPRLLVVALAEVNAGRVAAMATPGLAGIREGGRYVFYRVGGPVGWLSGETTLASTGEAVVGAIVESDTLPFIARSGMDVPYRLVARPGTAEVKGTKPGTRLAASATTAVVAGGPSQALPLPLVFSGVATTATVTPADGTQGVAVSVQVEVEATAPLDPSAENLARAKLFKGGEPVATRLQLSLSGKRLAVIPVQPLATSTEYTFTAEGLLDAQKDVVILPSPVVFRTKDFVPPVFNVDAIVFSYPENGMTRVTAPEGSLPPFSEVLVLNTTNGAVLWLQVDGNGCIGCTGGPYELPATINDRLMVTITDPQGNTVTLERSKFVKADGTVAIGPGGGTVVGSGGVELRIPSGALEKGVELKAEGVTAEELQQQFPGQVPNLGKNAEDKPVAHLAGGLKLTSKDEPTFKKPIDLAFPLPDFTKAAEGERPPPDKPEDAYYYVVRRVEGPCADGSDTCAAGERRVVFQTIDHAFVECPNGEASCEASEKKVVTASWPFGGYLDSYAVFSITPAGMMMQPVVATYAILMWTYTKDLPGAALPGVITGKVLRAKWNFGTTVPEYEVVKDKLVVVSAVGSNAERLLSGNEEITYASPVDGTFTLWDPLYTGGTVQVAATMTGVPGDPHMTCPETDGGDASVRCATAYESDPLNWKSTGLRFHRNIATVNITFPAVEPPMPAPAIGVTVYRTEGDNRVATGGIVPSGTPVILAIQPSSELITVQEVLVQGVSEGFRLDPLKGQETGAEWIVEYTPAAVGTYRVEVSGLGPNNLGKAERVTGGTTFRVIGAGGTDEIVDGQPPRVIEARTVPKDGATGVQVSTYVQVVFTEPVKNITGNVTLRKVIPPPEETPDEDPTLGAPIAVKLSGVLRGGGVVEDLDASPDAVITSLTVQPTSALEYGQQYRLDLAGGIKDLDTTETSGPCAPARCLVPYTTSFTTFTPTPLTENPQTFGSPGIVILGERAYLVENHFHSGTLRVFETTDPVNPQEIPNHESDPRDPRYTVSYRPVDLVGEADSPLTGGRIVAVATGPTAQSKPSNIWLLDVSDDSKTSWIGAVSLTKSAADGFISRTFLRAGVLYSATYKKGIQVVDLGLVTQSFSAPGSSGYFPMVQSFLSDNTGYGLENVINIRVDSPFGGPAHLNDVEAALMQTRDEGALVLVGAAGDPGLTVVNPAAQQVLWNGAVTVEREEDGQTVTVATLRYGQAIAMGNVSGSDVVVLVGTGTIGQDSATKPLLMVVKLDDPSHPVGLGFVQLDDATVGDVILKDDQALLGGSTQVTLVSLTDPTHPAVVGTIQGVGGRLAIASDGLILFGTAHSVFGGTDVPLGGVRTAALGSAALIEAIDPVLVQLDRDGKTLEPVTLTYRLISPAEGLEGLKIKLEERDRVVGEYALPVLTDGRFTVAIPAGVRLTPPPEDIEISLSGDGTAAGPVRTRVQTAGDAAAETEELMAPVPVFESLSPGHALEGQTEQAVKVTGTNLSGLLQVHVRDVEGNWTSLDVDSDTATSTSIAFRLTPTLLARQGFLQISPELEDSNASLAFVVGDPAIPQRGTAANIALTSVEPNELGPGGSALLLKGSGFDEGMRVVVGRDSGIALATEVLDEGQLLALLPPSYLGRAEDLYVAVLSADGSGMSAGLQVKSTVAERPVDYASILGAEATGVVGVTGTLIWNGGAGQRLTLAMAGPVGSEVAVEIRRGGEVFTALATRSPLPASTAAVTPPGAAGAVTYFDLRLPEQVTQWEPPRISFKVDDIPQIGRRPATGGAVDLGVLPIVNVPLGARLKFKAYQVNLDQLYLIPETDPAPYKCPSQQPQPGRLRTRYPGLTYTNRWQFMPVDNVTYSFLAPPVANPFTNAPIPLVLPEREGCPWADANALYLRGVRLSQKDASGLPSEYMTVTAKKGSSTGKLEIYVGDSILAHEPQPGQGRPLTIPQIARIDRAVIDAASAAGIPPQILKGQGYAETGLNGKLFRYEPMTIDFLVVSGDIGEGGGTTHTRDNSLYGTYVRRHMLGGTIVRMGSSAPSRECLVVLGPSANPSDAAIAGCARVTIAPTPPGHTANAIPLGPALEEMSGVLGYSGLPGGGGKDKHGNDLYPYTRLDDIDAKRYTPGPGGALAETQLTRTEPSTWSVASGATAVNRPDPTGNEYWFLFGTNELVLGQALQSGEWIKLKYHRLLTDTVAAGACAIDPATFNGRTKEPNEAVQYAAGWTINEWMDQNMRTEGGKFLNGTRAEEHVAFYNQKNVSPSSTDLRKRRRGVMDSRFKMATAQFVAAGSYGVLHATLMDWLTPVLIGTRRKIDILNQAFDLNDNCLPTLSDDDFQAFRLGSAALSAHNALEGPPPCTVCTQQQWAKYWAKVLKRYNPDGDGYILGADGLNKAVRYGVTSFNAW